MDVGFEIQKQDFTSAVYLGDWLYKLPHNNINPTQRLLNTTNLEMCEPECQSTVIHHPHWAAYFRIV